MLSAPAPWQSCHKGGAHHTDEETEAQRHVAKGPTLVPQRVSSTLYILDLLL